MFTKMNGKRIKQRLKLVLTFMYISTILQDKYVVRSVVLVFAVGLSPMPN